MIHIKTMAYFSYMGERISKLERKFLLWEKREEKRCRRLGIPYQPPEPLNTAPPKVPWAELSPGERRDIERGFHSIYTRWDGTGRFTYTGRQNQHKKRKDK